MNRRPPSRTARPRRPSRDEVALAGLSRLGFWPTGEALAALSEEDARRLLELRRELLTTASEQSRVERLAKLRRELRKKRLDEARAWRRLARFEREQARDARRATHRRTKQSEITYLGRGVSGGLAARTGDEARLARQGLVSLPTPEALAQAMGITVGRLRWLCYQRAVSSSTHYVRFQVPKKTGGMRLLAAPMPALKQAQRWVLDHVLAALPVGEAAHGFRPGRSIVSNARPHVGADVVVNLDLRDFFPSIVFPRVKGAFVSLGYGEATATVLALLTTECDRTEVQLDGARLYVAEGPRRLPQGAPTSPALSNLVCRRLDRRLEGVVRKQGFVYTRYADDLTFSGPSHADVAALLRYVHLVIADEGFVVHPDKTRVLRRGRKQEVTGVIVNDVLGVDRKTLRRFRALLHRIEQSGPEGKRWGKGAHVLASARGFASFVAMVDPDKGRALLAQVATLEARYGAPASCEQWLPEDASSSDVDGAKEPARAPSTRGEEPAVVEQVVSVKRWWKRG